MSEKQQERASLGEIGLGMLFGALGLVVGFLLYWLFLYISGGIGLSYFWNNMFLGTDIFKSKIITGAIVMDCLLFYLFMRLGKDSYNFGMLFVIILAVIAAVYFYIDS